MCTYDDFDGVYFSIQALKAYHPISKDIEIVVVDNNPSSYHGKATKIFVESTRQKYIPYEDKKSTSVRNEIFNHSTSKYTLCIDCHVLLMPGSLEALLSYYESCGDNCKDIVSGPLCGDHLEPHATQFDPVWRKHMYGIWGFNKEKLDVGQPFEIPMMGLGLFSCETKNWLGFNEHFRGFGGEEGYIHEKFRRSGGKCICIPQLQWVHRFARPNGARYPLALEDRIWNYFVGWLELTQDPNHPMVQSIYEHFVLDVDGSKINQIFDRAKQLYGL